MNEISSKKNEIKFIKSNLPLIESPVIVVSSWPRTKEKARSSRKVLLHKKTYVGKWRNDHEQKKPMKSYVPLDSLLCVRGCIKSRSKDIANLLFLYIFIRNFDSFSLFFLFNISICLHRMRCGLIIEIFHSYPTMNVEDIFSRRYISSIRENENVVVVFFCSACTWW